VVVESAIRHGLNPDNARVVENHAEAASILKQVIREGDWILVKGSRKMAMEKIAEEIIEGGT
jgi:UDP-N-acetylmuramyl pentapeptide synthase